MSEFTDDNASTTETDENKASEDIEELDEEEGTDGVSSEGEKTSGGTETVEVNFSKDIMNEWLHETIFYIFCRLRRKGERLKQLRHHPLTHVHAVIEVIRHRTQDADDKCVDDCSQLFGKKVQKCAHTFLN